MGQTDPGSSRGLFMKTAHRSRGLLRSSSVVRVFLTLAATGVFLCHIPAYAQTAIYPGNGIPVPATPKAAILGPKGFVGAADAGFSAKDQEALSDTEDKALNSAHS